MKNIFNRILALILIFFLYSSSAFFAETSEEKGLRIAMEMDKKDTGFGDSQSELLMILKNRYGEESEREMRVMMLEGGDDGDKSLIIFDTPKDVKGTALLTFTYKTGDDDQWLYLPALKRVKRISSSNKSGSFMGSEFAYEDLGGQEVEKYTYKWIKDEHCPIEEYKDLACFVIERYPIDKTSGYTRQLAWIDKDEYRMMKIDFYDRKESLLKTLTVSGYKKYLDKYWRPDEMNMVNHQTGKSTQLIWKNYQFQSGLTENDFSQARLKRTR
ncbi:outer membrane lipoprotein-sorting protein [Chlamydiota bacterium]